jgi:hypothetical protein
VIGSPQEQAVALWGARAVISFLGMVAFTLLRLSWLRTQGLLPAQMSELYLPAAGARRGIRAGLGRAYRVLWSRDHVQIDDLWLSALVFAARGLLVLSLALMLADGYASHR